MTRLDDASRGRPGWGSLWPSWRGSSSRKKPSKAVWWIWNEVSLRGPFGRRGRVLIVEEYANGSRD